MASQIKEGSQVSRHGAIFLGNVGKFLAQAEKNGAYGNLWEFYGNFMGILWEFYGNFDAFNMFSFFNN